MANPFVDDARIDEEIRKVIGKSLRKDPSAIPMDASIVKDLGGASLDFLDMTFRLEQAFGVRLPHTTLLDHMEETFGEGKAITPDGTLTQDAVQVLRLRLGDHPDLAAGMFSDEVPVLVTPGTLRRGVREILARLPTRCTHCQVAAWQGVDGVKVRCGSCGKDAVYPDGDALTREWLEAQAREKGLFAA
jgi:acyl carrier protein